MKKLLLLSVFCFLLQFLYSQNKPQEIIITGEILHDQDTSAEEVIKLVIDDAATTNQLIESIFLKKDGRFEFRFERYIPQSVMLIYKTYTSLLVSPGDSIHLKIDGRSDDFRKTLSTIEYSGRGRRVNEELREVDLLLDSVRVPYEEIAKNRESMDAIEYKTYQQHIRADLQQHRDHFVAQGVSPLVIDWTQSRIDLDYFRALLRYSKQRNVGYNPDFEDFLTKGYYDFVEEIYHMPDAQISLTAYRLTNAFLFRYIYGQIRKASKDLKNKSYMDSLAIHTVLKHTAQHDLFRQMVLCEFLNIGLERYDVSVFEQYKTAIVDKYITAPHLIEPLLERYEQVKLHLGSPVVKDGMWIKNAKGTEAKQLVQGIVDSNANKIVYIDFWGTWCAPCRAEMPKAKTLKKWYASDDISFVYICIDSNVEQWKAALSDMQIEGIHYFLDSKGSRSMRASFDISGIPHYMLIDQEGNLVASGHEFRPSNPLTKEKIDKLLKK